MKKYRMFLKDAENPEVSIPLRIEAYFQAAFHLIEAVAALHNVHINKHKLVRRVLEQHPEIFGEDSEEVWRAFQTIENQIRPGQVYGGRIDGEALRKTEELFRRIRRIAEKRLKGVSSLDEGGVRIRL